MLCFFGEVLVFIASIVELADNLGQLAFHHIKARVFFGEFCLVALDDFPDFALRQVRVLFLCRQHRVDYFIILAYKHLHVSDRQQFDGAGVSAEA